MQSKSQKAEISDASGAPVVSVLKECLTFLNDLTDPDGKATGSNIIATFANAIALRSKVAAALASAREVRS